MSACQPATSELAGLRVEMWDVRGLLIHLRWSLLKDLIHENEALVLQDPQLKMVYKSLLRIPTCALAKV